MLWTKGITAPNLNQGGDFRKLDTNTGLGRFVEYYAPFSNHFLNSGWYDVDKSISGDPKVDQSLCFAAVASNQLHWWLKNNQSRVDQFLTKTNYLNNLPSGDRHGLKDLTTYPNSFKSQQNSAVFNMFKVYFGGRDNGYQVDPLIDMFINGYKPKPHGGVNQENWPTEFEKDDRGGFFYSVFGRKLLTQRMTTNPFHDFSNQLKRVLRAGKSIGIIHASKGGYAHVITAWGAEYDLDGKLVGVYVTDSDDRDQTVNGMKRYGVNNINGRAVLSNNLTKPNHGATVDSVVTFELGDEQWNNFLK